MFKVWLICNNHKTDLSNIYLILKSYCTDFLCRILFLIVNLLLFAGSTGILIFWHFLLPSDCFLLMLYKEFVSIFFCLWQKITSSLLNKMYCKTASCLFYLFSPLCSSSFLSLIVSRCWALPPLSSDDGSSSRCWYNEKWQDGRALFLPNGPKSDNGL